MSQDYFRFEHDLTIGVICSSSCNIVYGTKNNYALCGALEGIYVWNIRTGEIAQKWVDNGNTAEVVTIAASPTDENIFAAGYADGSVRIWDLRGGGLSLVFHGHRGMITTLAFSPNGTTLASGACDNEIVIWDLVSENGLYRLRGHGSAISGLSFLEDGNALVSTSKDTLMKIWDLSSQCCIETIVLHHSEITGMVHCLSSQKIITVSADNKIRIFKVNSETIKSKISKDLDEEMNVVQLIETVNRSSNGRAIFIDVDAKDRYFSVIGADRSVEIWKLRTQEEFSKQEGKKLQSWCKHVRYTRLQFKINSIAFATNWKTKVTGSLKCLAQFNDNRIGEMIIPLDNSQEIGWPMMIERVGHRSECKAVSFSQDSSLFATAGREEVKVWNSITGSLVRSIVCNEPTAIVFFNETKNLLVGDNEGMIHFVDLITSDVIDSVKAHDGTIHTIALRPDGKGMMSGGADKNIKFWEFKLLRTKLKLIKTLQMNDEVLYLRYSPDLRYIAMATMDLTIKVFFEDSLKFYLSLYGHKLPITAFDISADSKLLISASADKNVKIWSLEFGECRKSIFAHSDIITAIAFIPDTKLFITASKDKTLKYWDCMNFSSLQTLTGHQREIWTMAISPQSDRIVSVSRDKSIRIWRLTEEMLFPEEEQERELEERFEKSMIEENPHEKEDSLEENGKASTKTIASMKAGERIMECIEAADDERRKWDEYNAAKSQGILVDEPTPGAFYMALGRDKTPAEFVLSAFERVPLPDAEEALLCLPTNVIPSLLFYINEWLRSRRNVVMSSRILDMTLRLFHISIMANPSLRLLLESIKDIERSTLLHLKDIIGFNNVSIEFL